MGKWVNRTLAQETFSMQQILFVKGWEYGGRGFSFQMFLSADLAENKQTVNTRNGRR